MTLAHLLKDKEYIKIWRYIYKNGIVVSSPNQIQFSNALNICKANKLNFVCDYLAKLYIAYNYSQVRRHYKTGNLLEHDILNGKRIYPKSYI